MPSHDHHEIPFQSHTQTKLQIFEDYLKSWLPVWLNTPGCNKVVVCDFFAGPGIDSEGNLGSPLRIIEKIKNFKEMIEKNCFQIKLILNEYDVVKFNSMRNLVLSAISTNNLDSFVSVQFHNCKFEDLFPMISNSLGELPSLIFIDQNGIKQVTQEVFNELISFEKSDFLFFISSSFFRRFASEASFSQLFPDLEMENLMSCKVYEVHNIILKEYKKLIPQNVNAKLYPFILKKNSNYYGLIFGAKHPLAVDKFLSVAWVHNPETGDANFQLDEEIAAQQTNLFGLGQKTKLERFNEDLEEFILGAESITNKEIYNYCIDNGFCGKHGKEVVMQLRRSNKVSYDSPQPGINYTKCYKNNEIIIIRRK